MDTPQTLNGYCVSGFCLAILGFIGTFYIYIEKIAELSPHTAYWFGIFHHAAPILFVLGGAFSVVGLIECRKFERFSGRGLSIAGLVLAGLTVPHWIITGAVFDAF
jgi:hypothetical protein